MALGGGVVGDTAGLVAALYMRGVAFVQAPTSVVAMADSSIGGKVGVDHPAAKNLHRARSSSPRWSWPTWHTLASLPAAETRNGLAEILKAGLIAGGRSWPNWKGRSCRRWPTVLRPAIEVKQPPRGGRPLRAAGRAPCSTWGTPSATPSSR